MRNFIFSLLTAILVTGCTLDASLFRGSLGEDAPPSTVLPNGAIDAGFVNQLLPTSLTKSVGNFGSISAQNYYFLQSGPESDIVRKFVKISGATKTELALPSSVMAHTYAFSTTSRVYYYSYEVETATTAKTYLRAIDKATFTDAGFNCSGIVVDVDPETFEVWQEGAEGFYFRLNSTNPAATAFNGHIFYSDGATCTDTLAISPRVFKASNKIYVIHSGNLYKLTAGTPTLLRDSTNRPVDSGLVEYQGNLYFRADVDATGVTNYRLNRLNAATDDSIDEILTETAADYPPADVTQATLDGTHYYYCVNAGCVSNQDIFHLDMSTYTANLVHTTEMITKGRILPFDTAKTFVETGDGGDLFKLSELSNINVLTDVLDTNVRSEYPDDGNQWGSLIYFPQYIYFGGTYIFSGYDPAGGNSLFVRLNPGTMNLDPILTTFHNPYSMRLRGGEIFFLSDKDKKIQLYRSDGTDVGTTAVTEISSDDYRLGADYFVTGGKNIRRTFDLTKEGSDLYVFTSGKEKLYLGEYTAGGQVKYVEIPGALQDDTASNILKVQNNQIIIATPAHAHTGKIDVGGTRQHLHQPPGSQIISYDGTTFTYWLDGDWALPTATPFYYYLGGQEFLAIGENRIVTTLMSPISNAGLYMRRVFSMTKTAMTDLFSENSQAHSFHGGGDKFVMSVDANTAGNDGTYLNRAGINLKITTTATEARSFRWDGDIVYFIAKDIGDGLTYVWKMDASQASPTPQKISPSQTLGTAPETEWAQKTYTLGSTTYMFLPAADGDNSVYGDHKLNLWQVSGGVASRYSDELIEESVMATDGLYLIARPVSGPHAWEFCVRRLSATGTAISDYKDYLIYLKPSPLGLTVSSVKNILMIKTDMSFTEIAPIYSTMSESDFDTAIAPLKAGYSPQQAALYLNYSAADSKIMNWGFVDLAYSMRAIYRDLDGTNSQEHLYADVTFEVPDGHNMMAPFSSERPRGNSFTSAYVPQVNSLLYIGHTGLTGFRMFITGKNGLLDASPP